MKQRLMRGLEKPKNTGIGKICSAMAKCASETIQQKVFDNPRSCQSLPESNNS